MIKNRSILIGIVLIGLSIAGLAIAAPNMARKLAARENHLVWFDKPIGVPRFDFLGDPVAIDTMPMREGDPASALAIEIRYRGGVLSFPLEDGQREDDRLPGLLRHDDWMRVLVFAEGARTEPALREAVSAGEITPRMVIAMRRLPEDFDPSTWGAVRRREWRYRFVELLPASAADEPFRIYEETYGDIEKLGDPGYRQWAGREADYWKFTVMQHVTPPTLFRAKSRPVEGAMKAMGWTWPAAGLSIMGLVVGGGMLALGSRSGSTNRARHRVG